MISSALALCLAAGALRRGKWSLPNLALALGALLLAGEAWLNYFSAESLDLDRAMEFQKWRLRTVACVPAVWLLFALTYARGDHMSYVRKWRWALATFFFVPVGTAAFFQYDLVRFDGSSFRIGAAGRAVQVFLLIGATAILMHVERTFRAAVGVMRWQVKFMVIGLAALFLTRVYTSTQVLLYSIIDAGWGLMNTLALGVGSALALVSISRTKGATLDIYPAQTLVYQSLAVLLVGAYLLAVGVLANAAAFLGQARSFPLQALLLLLAFAGLGLVLLSDRAKLQTKRLISRYLHRPVYDFRKLWRTFSEQTAGQVDEVELCRASVKWIAETLDVLSVTAWLAPERGGPLVFAASTALTQDAASHLPRGDKGLAQALDQFRRRGLPMDIDAAPDDWLSPLRSLQPKHFTREGNRICLPAVAGNEIAALIVLGDRVSGVPFTVEDFDLLKCIGDQVGRDLIRIRLSQHVAEAKEMQAFQTMATFFVHDLKNTAWTLSLLVENLRDHFDRPDFREDAVRAVSKSVGRINDLISRLGTLRQELQLKVVPANLSEVVEKALKEFAGLADVKLTKTLNPVPNAMLDVEQMLKVISNLILNAREALPPGGEIHVETAQENGHALLIVRDTGCGMSEEFVQRRLFRPFQTTKKKGIGIGMFQSKMIVEAHRGKIAVDSVPGEGTTFRITLPLQEGTN